MARAVQEVEGNSLLVGEMPHGCRLCATGSKMVLFVTGLCDSGCFYCPLSEEKSNEDVTYADEMIVGNEDDILTESESIGAEGAGFSGGDPLCTLERTLRYLTLLKSTHGEQFHIHLYTSQADVEKEVLKQLRDAGLDEIRFHPMNDDWSGIEAAIKLGMTVGVEVPAIPGERNTLEEVAKRAEKMGVSFLNINELESSETNFDSLLSKGLKLKSTDSSAILGSAELARAIVEWASENLDTLSVHYCSAKFKDSVQMRNRLKRRLERTIREFEVPAEDEPLVILGLIRAPHGSELSLRELEAIKDTLEADFDVPLDLMHVDMLRNRIEIAGWILTEIAEELKGRLTGNGINHELGIVVEYPSWDRLQTQFDPL
ncbi:MAG: radical SAM protein [Promethearchaeota archaeon]